MKRSLLALTAVLSLTSCASLENARADMDRGPFADALDTLDAAGFAGDFAIMLPGEVDQVVFGHAGGDIDSRAIEGWPWASVTKQVIAVLVMQNVEEGRLALDSDVGAIMPRLAGRGLTVEDLLRHRSDLPNPDDTSPDTAGVPSFYTTEAEPLAFCTGTAVERPSDQAWSYNNCDYIVLGAVLEMVSGASLDLQIAQSVGLASGWINTRLLDADDLREFAGATPQTAKRIAGYGASAGLVGPLDDMIAFDGALLRGELLSDASLAILWEGDPAQGFMALGQWVFEAPLAGCDTPVRVVERRGAIGDYQVRNLILPDRGIAIALATRQSEWEFGEIWRGSGPSHDVLSAVACG
ncbi:serine hydrolase domain-containing protein [Aurantiacibacter aquimixticola]|uniref:Class A beta-lactamase-related serine hydrolase n=1 Tax=Aurantiacibacter aquimixticola TaxID=1958945 RepID=A0A419RQF1_9SPHN|nr:serine hydrolase domain-containing protein [Aurantiacibacter aquimixticola]RJY07997.1 class A beta-lactamase-related serine hydrolase [Aurantiacibacter aquimixticola]